MRLVFVIIIPVILSKKAYAYLDPGTGSYFFQIAIASFFGGLFLLKTFWKDIRKKIASLFGKKPQKDRD